MPQLGHKIGITGKDLYSALTNQQEKNSNNHLHMVTTNITFSLQFWD